MGNGYTFPLESVMFHAWALACCEYHDVPDYQVSTFGDDVVLPSSVYETWCRVLTAVGHKPNAAKSFFKGPFRESCGKDYFLGIDIRPFFFKKPLNFAQLFKAHNFFQRRGDEEMCEAILFYIPKDIRLWGPDGFGDGHLIGDYSRALPVKLRKKGYGGFSFDTYVYKPTEEWEKNEFGDRVLPMYASYVASNGGLTTEAHPYSMDEDDWDHLRKMPCGVAPRYRDGIRVLPVPKARGYRRISIYHSERCRVSGVFS